MFLSLPSSAFSLPSFSLMQHPATNQRSLALKEGNLQGFAVWILTWATRTQALFWRQTMLRGKRMVGKDWPFSGKKHLH